MTMPKPQKWYYIQVYAPAFGKGYRYAVQGKQPEQDDLSPDLVNLFAIKAFDSHDALARLALGSQKETII